MFWKILKVIATLSMIVSVTIIITNLVNPDLTNYYFFKLITWLAIIGLVSHFLEAIIAFIYTYNKADNPFQLAIYTFFTGTLGLREIWRDY